MRLSVDIVSLPPLHQSKYINGGRAGMLTSQRMQLELSELRNKINAMANSDDYEVDALESLNGEYRKAEVRFQAALIEEASEEEHAPDGDVDGETLEIRELRHNVQTAAYVTAALLQEPLTGREKELNEALQLRGAGHIEMPWAALLSDNDRLQLRAATEAPDTSDVVTNRILGRVFASGALQYLGVSFPTVPPGASNFPVLSAGVAPATADKEGAANQTAATLTPNIFETAENHG